MPSVHVLFRRIAVSSVAFLVVLCLAPAGSARASDEAPPSATPADPSASRLYHSVMGYFDSFHGKVLEKGQKQVRPGERRRSGKAFNTEDTEPRGAVEMEKRLALMRAERKEWDLAAQSLERAVKTASGMAATEEAQQLQGFLRTAREKSQQVAQEGASLPGESSNSIGMRLVCLPGGAFTMGSSTAEIRRIRNDWNVEENLVQPESPAHSVKISLPFLVGKYPVTVGQFRLFVSETAYRTVAEGQGWGWVYDKAKKHWTKKSGASWKNPGFEIWDDQPVTMICHADAEVFCEWLSKKEGRRYHLPTEAQWEYAARGGQEGRRYPWGDDYPDGSKANLADRNSPVPWADFTLDDHSAGPSPVGSYDPNGFGLYDMVGNVWNFCADYYDSKAYEGTASKVSVDPTVAVKGVKRVTRGGNWAFGAGIARNAFRYGVEMDLCTDISGFRVAAMASGNDEPINTANRKILSPELATEAQVSELVDRVKELSEAGRRLEARRLVDRLKLSNSAVRDSLQQHQGFVKDVLYSMIDQSGDKSHQSLTNSLGMKMIRIPAGAFVMGSSESDIAWAMTTLSQAQPVTLENEFPFHKVRITRPFFISSTEVTVALFRTFVDETGYITDAEDSKGGQVFNIKDGRFEQKAGTWWKEPGWTISDDQPVVMVSFNDAQAFAEWLTAKEKIPYKLPTEAQWEYAARGGIPMAQFPWGDAVPDGKRADYADKNTEFEWRDRDADDGYKHVAPVGSYPANGFGLYDMAGNAIEWVRDYYGEDYYRFTPEIDPEGPGHGEFKVTKGGDWTFSAVGLRCAFRGWSRPDLAFYNTGFRVVIETASLQRPFDFAANFLTREWVPGPDQREVTAAVAKEKERQTKASPPTTAPPPPKSIPDAASVKGVMILDFTPKSDAKKAGLTRGDIIIEYEGTGDLTTDKLLALTGRTKKDKARPVVVFVRDGQEYSVRVAPGILGISVMDTVVRVSPRRTEPAPHREPLDDKDKKLKPKDWT